MPQFNVKVTLFVEAEDTEAALKLVSDVLYSSAIPYDEDCKVNGRHNKLKI
jgi:hypothetical protein